MARLSRRRAIVVVRLVVAAVAVSRWIFDRVEVEGGSMLPTFAPGDRLLLVRRWRPVRTGDLVIVPDPRDEARRLVKRARATHGDDVEVLGDNAEASTDSRAFGPVPASSITYFVVRRYATRTAP
jgi:signal peptidase I